MAHTNVANSLVSVEFLPDGTTPAISSRDLALHFQKKHKNVLQEIERLRSEIPGDFAGLNFQPSDYTDPTGRTLPCFLLTRDGFSLLAMGFTGTAALRWKIQYIAAFNALEAAVRENARTAALAAGTQAGYALSPLQKRRLARVVYYRRKGLGVKSIAKLIGVHGREVSHLLRVGAALGRLAESRTLKPTAVASVASRGVRAEGAEQLCCPHIPTQPEQKKEKGGAA